MIQGSSKKKNVNMMSLPNELTEQILLKLPLNSLLRFKVVCKRWKFLIESPRFNECYHNPRQPEEGNCNNNLLVSIISNKHIYTIDLKKLYVGRSSLNIKDYHATQNMCSINLTGSVGTCNGLLCLTNYYRVFLYNPSTKMYSLVPNPPFHNIPREHWGELVYGFGYDHSTYDYKVVRIIWIYTLPFVTQTCHQVDVYSLKRKSWKTLKGFPNGNLSVEHSCDYGVFVNNALHWILSGSVVRGGILRFDLSSETFSLLPWHREWDNGPDVFLNMIEGCLGAWFKRAGDKIEIWVMKTYGIEESCWTKLLTIQTDAQAVTLIAFSKDWGRLLLAESVTDMGQNTKFCWYDIDTSERKWEIEVQNCNQDKIYEVETSLQSKLTLPQIKKLGKKRAK